MKLRSVLRPAIVGVALSLSGGAFAHEAAARYGGILRSVNDLQFELVARDSGAIVFVHDHGKPVSTAGMSGKLTILTGKDTSETPLAPAGENRLEAKGAKLGSGAKVVASILRDGKTISVRFAVK